MPFGFHVADIVLPENRPLGGVVLRQVAGAPAVGLGGLAGAAEVADQRSALTHFGFVLRQLQGFARVLQAGGQPAVHGVYHAVLPLVEPVLTLGLWQLKVFAQAPPFKGGIPRALGDAGVKQQRLHAVKGKGSGFGQVQQLHAVVVRGKAAKQNLKVGVLGVAVCAHRADVLRAVGFQINRE